jgi:hypothetical protein
MKRVHCTFCGQTFATDTTAKCPLCRQVGGLVDPGSPAAVRDVVARKHEQAPSPGVASVGQAYQAVRFALGGLFAIGLGIFLIANPDFRTHPNRLELRDLWPGLAAIIAGLGMLGLVVNYAKRGVSRTRPSSHEEPLGPRAEEGGANHGTADPTRP